MIDRTTRTHFVNAVATLLAARERGMIPRELKGEPRSPLAEANRIADKLTISGNPGTAEQVTVRLPEQGLEFKMNRRDAKPPREGSLNFVECAVMLVLSECGWKLPFPIIITDGGYQVSVAKGGLVSLGCRNTARTAAHSISA